MARARTGAAVPEALPNPEKLDCANPFEELGVPGRDPAAPCDGAGAAVPDFRPGIPRILNR